MALASRWKRLTQSESSSRAGRNFLESDRPVEFYVSSPIDDGEAAPAQSPPGFRSDQWSQIGFLRRPPGSGFPARMRS